MKFKVNVNGKIFDKPSKFIKYVVDNGLTNNCYRGYGVFNGVRHYGNMSVERKSILDRDYSRSKSEYSKYKVVRS